MKKIYSSIPCPPVSYLEVTKKKKKINEKNMVSMTATSSLGTFRLNGQCETFTVVINDQNYTQVCFLILENNTKLMYFYSVIILT